MQAMKQIKAKPNQTLFDIALEQYGTCEAVEEILRLNPNIKNEKTAKTSKGIDYILDTDFYIDLAVESGLLITIDADSELRQASILKDLQNINITTFSDGKND